MIELILAIVMTIGTPSKEEAKAPSTQEPVMSTQGGMTKLITGKNG